MEHNSGQCGSSSRWVLLVFFSSITIVLTLSKNCVSSDLKSECTTLVLVSLFFHKLHPSHQPMCNFFSNTDGTIILSEKITVSVMQCSCDDSYHNRNVHCTSWFPYLMDYLLGTSFHILSSASVPEDAQVHWFHVPFPFLAGKFVTIHKSSSTVSLCSLSIQDLTLIYNVAGLLQCHSRQYTWHLSSS